MLKPLLKWIYLSNPKFFTDLAFNRQSKPIEKYKLDWCFIDSNGKRYYKFIDDMEMPVERYGQIQRLLVELSNCISGPELKIFLTKIMEHLDPGAEEGERKKIRIGEAIHLVQEMLLREDLLLHPEIMMEIISASYIREDENPAKWDEELHQEKVAQFRKDSKTGLYDFFHKPGLAVLIPFAKLSEVEWLKYWAKSGVKIKAMKRFLSESKSTKKEKTISATT